MDHAKLDGPLALRVENTTEEDREARAIPVIIRLADAPSEEQSAILRDCGVSGPPEGRRTTSADLSRRDVERLSDEPWVTALSLSMPRYPMRPARRGGLS
ncbi:hypothetical protein [Streptomyces sp. NPDC001678]|uniref:hypothetical protein n=1 Tax=Streptomyces sp. NPDC001678 TaxID=3364599 RepID=UPI003677AC25